MHCGQYFFAIVIRTPRQAGVIDIGVLRANGLEAVDQDWS